MSQCDGLHCLLGSVGRRRRGEKAKLKIEQRFCRYCRRAASAGRVLHSFRSVVSPFRQRAWPVLLPEQLANGPLTTFEDAWLASVKLQGQDRDLHLVPINNSNPRPLPYHQSVHSELPCCLAYEVLFDTHRHLTCGSFRPAAFLSGQRANCSRAPRFPLTVFITNIRTFQNGLRYLLLGPEGQGWSDSGYHGG